MHGRVCKMILMLVGGHFGELVQFVLFVLISISVDRVIQKTYLVIKNKVVRIKIKVLEMYI